MVSAKDGIPSSMSLVRIRILCYKNNSLTVADEKWLLIFTDPVAI